MPPSKRVNKTKFDDHDPRREQFLERPLPSNEDAEKAVLGGILLDNGLMSQAVEQLTPEDFYGPLHRRIFGGMVALFNAGKKIDPILIAEELKKDGSIEGIGGVATITNLTYGLPHFTDITDYVKVVKDYSTMRELIRACNSIVSDALEGEQEPGVILNTAQASINEIVTRDMQTGFVSAGALAQQSVAKVNEILRSGDGDRRVVGVPTGYREFDFITGGMKAGDFIVLGGRPGMGKSMLAGNICENICKEMPGAVVAVFTLEMSSEQYIERMIASSAGVPLRTYQRGLFHREQGERINAAIARFSTYAIEIDDAGVTNAMEMKAKLLRLRALHKRLDFILVDFLQKVSPVGRAESRQQEVSAVARELKSLAKYFKVPLMAISSLSRECEKRKPPKPIMSDLRESGDIESEADVVGFIYRDHKYNTASDPSDADFLMGKNRHGEEKNFKLTFIPDYARFEDVALLPY